MYKPEAIVLQILSIQDAAKKEGYMLEIDFHNQRVVAKPSPGALALFFKDQDFRFPFVSRGVIDFKLIRMNPSGGKEVAAVADFNLMALMGNMDAKIHRSLMMRWVGAYNSKAVKPLLSFDLFVHPPPPSDLERSVWGDLNEEDFPDLHTSHPELPLFNELQPGTGESLWLDMQKASVFLDNTRRHEPTVPVDPHRSRSRPLVGIPPQGHYGPGRPSASGGGGYNPAPVPTAIYNRNVPPAMPPASPRPQQQQQLKVWMNPPAVQPHTSGMNVEEMTLADKIKQRIDQAIGGRKSGRIQFARSQTEDLKDVPGRTTVDNDPRISPFQSAFSRHI